MWQFVINGPGYFDTAYDVPEGVTKVGRADENDIVLSGDLVSRRHARIHVKADSISYEDLGSRNGSKLNATAATGTTPLNSGDVIAIGDNTLVVRSTTKAETAATEMIDQGAGGVRRFGRGADLSGSVMAARDIRDSVVLKALDNIAPFEVSKPPVPGTGDEDAHTNQSQMESPVAWQSLALLYRVAERLSTCANLQAFLEETVDAMVSRTGSTTGVALLRHTSGVLVPAAVRHSRKLQKGEVPVSDAVIEVALSQGKAVAVANVQDDERFAARESVVIYGVDQVLCVPIGQSAPFTGVLYLNRSSSSGGAGVEDLLDLCTAIAQLVQLGVHKFQARPEKDDRLRQALERFHAPDIVERRVAELSAAGAPLTLLEERQVTALFADLADFTALSKKLPKEKVTELLNEFYAISTRAIFSYEGTVDKFMGDSVMALFGAPYEKGDDAIRAVRAANLMLTDWEKAMARRPPKERCRLKAGLNSGKVLAGTVGSQARLDYTAIGEPINVAAWLCASASAGQVLITGKTLAAVGARFDVTPLGERALKQNVKSAVFEVIEEDNESGTLSGIRSGPQNS